MHRRIGGTQTKTSRDDSTTNHRPVARSVLPQLRRAVPTNLLRTPVAQAWGAAWAAVGAIKHHSVWWALLGYAVAMGGIVAVWNA